MEGHKSADSAHYDTSAENYDVLNEEKSKEMNRVIDQILKKYKAKTVLDLTCGTGSQVFWLTNCGYEVIGSDINEAMLKKAKEKANKNGLKLTFLKGDMCSLRVGKFDAAITIFNAIGHLTKADFERTIQNIHSNLNQHGLYIFDIFNLTYLLSGDNIAKLTIDWVKESGNEKVRKIQYSTIDKAGILASYTTSLLQVGGNMTQISEEKQTLQVYSAEELKEMLDRNGFEVLCQRGVDEPSFDFIKTERILTVARKK